MAKIRRNDPCPCGSGRKYKRCCQNRDHEHLPLWEGNLQTWTAPGADAVPIALDWLYERYDPAMKAAFYEAFFAGLSFEDDVVALMRLPDFFVEMIDAHGREIALAEGVLALEDGEVSCLDAVLGPGGPPLDAVQREYLETLGRRSVSFYQVVEPRPGEGFRVRDLLDEDEPERWIGAPLLAQGLVGAQGSIFAARLMPGDPWTISCDAVCPWQKDQVSIPLKHIREERVNRPQEDRRTRSTLAVTLWLQLLARTPPGTIQNMIHSLDQVC